MRNFIWTVIVVGALAPAAGAQGTVAGWVVEQTMSMRGTSLPSMNRDTRLRTTFAGGNSRTDFLDGFPSDHYSVTPAGDSSRYAVDTVRRVVRRTPRDLKALAEITGQGIPTSSSFKVDTIGPGPVLLGHKTTHYRITPKQAISVRLPGSPSDSTDAPVAMSMVMDYYSTDELKAFEHPMRQAGTPVPATGIPGFPLLTETHGGFGAGGMTVSTKLEVTSVAEKVVNPAIFELPADYQRVNALDEMRAMRARSDSLLREVNKSNPEFGARMKAIRDSIFGLRDTTKVRKP